MDGKDKLNNGYKFKINIDATQAKEELKTIEEQVDIVTKKYKEFERLYRKGNFTRDIFIFLAYLASMFWLFKNNIIYAAYYLILIIVIGQVYKGVK